MEALLILVFIVFVIVILSANSKTHRHLSDINSEISGLRADLSATTKSQRSLSDISSQVLGLRSDIREFLSQSRAEIRQLRETLPAAVAPAAAAPPPPKPEAPLPKPAAPVAPPEPKPEPPKPAPLPELPKPAPPVPEPPKPLPPVPEIPKFLPPVVPVPEPKPEPVPRPKPTPDLAPEAEDPALKALPPRSPLPVPDPPVSGRYADRVAAIRAEATPPAPPPPPPPPPPFEPRPGFFERHPDLEKFIGENLISKIGIAILVIGIGFFVKFAIDQNWIPPAGRVAIGMLCGGILIGLAHRLQRAYQAFSSVLVGGGLAVCYYTIALAYQDYHLMSQPLAFGIMAALTAFAAVLSLLYDRQEVAIIAMAGGFTAPFLVSNGSGNYVVLFSYLLLLNTSLLIIAYRKSWRLLNGIAFGATVLLFAGWVGTLDPGTPAKVYRGGLFFAAAFYLLFLAINLAHNVSKRKTFIASDFSILLANTGIFFGGGIYLLEQGGWEAGRGIFAIALALLNFGLTTFLVRRGNVDKTILYLFIGITLSFVSLTAPLQLSGHSITLFWAAETVVILWLFMRTGYSILKLGLGIVWLCTWISLILDWNLYFFRPASFPVILNRGFLTSMYVVAAHAVMYHLVIRQRRNEAAVQAPPLVAPLAGAVALILCYATGFAEVWLQISARALNREMLPQYLLGYTLAYIIALELLQPRYLKGIKPEIMTGLMLLGFVAYLGSCLNVYHIQESLWHTYGRFSHFSVHWISAAFAAYISLRLLRTLREGPLQDSRTGLAVFAALFGLLFVSVETGLLIRLSFAHDVAHLPVVDTNYVRIGLPIVWGLYSFFLMWQGMSRKNRVLRIISLSIFCITLLKLFLVDIRRLGPGGKIAAFCSLGVLLLVISFMYQRLRRLLTEDKPHDDPDPS